MFADGNAFHAASLSACPPWPSLTGLTKFGAPPVHMCGTHVDSLFGAAQLKDFVGVFCVLVVGD